MKKHELSRVLLIERSKDILLHGRDFIFIAGGMDNCVKLWDTAKLWDDLSEDGVTTTVNA